MDNIQIMLRAISYADTLGDKLPHVGDFLRAVTLMAVAPEQEKILPQFVKELENHPTIGTPTEFLQCLDAVGGLLNKTLAEGCISRPPREEALLALCKNEKDPELRVVGRLTLSILWAWGKRSVIIYKWLIAELAVGPPFVPFLGANRENFAQVFQEVAAGAPKQHDRALAWSGALAKVYGAELTEEQLALIKATNRRIEFMETENKCAIHMH